MPEEGSRFHARTTVSSALSTRSPARARSAAGCRSSVSGGARSRPR